MMLDLRKWHELGRLVDQARAEAEQAGQQMQTICRDPESTRAQRGAAIATYGAATRAWGNTLQRQAQETQRLDLERLFQCIRGHHYEPNI
jgi:hypothetical protein